VTSFLFPPSVWLCAPVCCLPHQYHLIPTALPWSRAQTYCREHHADLATVSDTEDVERLLNAARGSAGKAWIGLHDNPTSWRWSFSDSCYYGEKEADYRNWGFGQPDNFFGDEMCVRMRAGGAWESSRCFLSVSLRLITPCHQT
uniref:C-type lectin domain-containing protein n=1 Tax=Mola mola TaxID=94237 RepID=A0A3Q4BY31_MOLML